MQRLEITVYGLEHKLKWVGSEGLDYAGATQGPGECAAEAYWRYFAGRLPEESRRIIDTSPAFKTLQQGLDRD